MTTALSAAPPVPAVDADMSDSPLPFTLQDVAAFCRNYPELRTELNDSMTRSDYVVR
jgi:hypothetical protein